MESESKILEKLNEEQRLPLLARDGAVLVTAGAGSGKTRMLTHRIAYLIEQRVRDYNILAITFTNKATNELRERVTKLLGCPHGVWISTFHSFCLKILRSHIDKLEGYTSKFSIYADAERTKVLKGIYQQLNIEEDSERKSIDYHLSNSKNNNMPTSKYACELEGTGSSDSIIKAMELYQAELRSSNALDFDDLLVKTYELFVKFPDVLEYYANKFEYIHVDEFQDTNTVQYDILKLLASKHGNILVVGDEDQSIYGWRGANIQNISNFMNDFPKVNVFKLEQNYRSSKAILNVANKVIANNTQRLLKTLWTNNPDGKGVEYYIGDSDRDEADYVVRAISKLARDEGYRFSDIAILMRYSAPSRLIEERLINYNMPYAMLGGFKFFERAEIKNVLAYIRAVLNPSDNESFLRIINTPKRGIGETTVAKLLERGRLVDAIRDVANNESLSSASRQKVADFNAVYEKLVKLSAELSPLDFIEQLINIAGFTAAYKQSGNEEDYERLKNLDALLESVAEFEANNEEVTLAGYIESVTLISDIDSFAEDNNNILLSTVHAVKGLEFKVVFIIALEDGIFPIIRMGGDRPSDVEEERRLMYVALTRAKERLILTRARNRFLYNEGRSAPASRFLKEMELEFAGGVKAQPRTFGESAYGFGETGANRFNAVTTGFNSGRTGSNATSSQSGQFGGACSFNKPKPEIDCSGFKLGVMVGHPKFGVGHVTDDSKLASKLVTIDFGGFGVKTLSLDFAPLTILKKKE